MPINGLVTLAQDNDFKAVEELIKREQKNIFAAFSYLCDRRECVLDLTQEALMRMTRSLPKLKDPKNFKSWLNRIVTNLFYDEMRRTQRRPDTVPLDSGEDDDMPKIQLMDKKCKPAEKCMSNELEANIKKAILDLPDKFRIAIILREMQGLSYEEIAKATHSSLGTVKSRIARAREKLQEGLKVYI